MGQLVNRSQHRAGAPACPGPEARARRGANGPAALRIEGRGLSLDHTSWSAGVGSSNAGFGFLSRRVHRMRGAPYLTEVPLAWRNGIADGIDGYQAHG